MHPNYSKEKTKKFLIKNFKLKKSKILWKMENLVNNRLLFDFWSKVANFSIFSQICGFWPNFRFLTKLSIFDKLFDFWPTFRFLAKFAIFSIYLPLTNICSSYCKIHVATPWEIAPLFCYLEFPFFVHFTMFTNFFLR